MQRFHVITEVVLLREAEKVLVCDGAVGRVGERGRDAAAAARGGKFADGCKSGRLGWRVGERELQRTGGCRADTFWNIGAILVQTVAVCFHVPDADQTVATLFIEIVLETFLGAKLTFFNLSELVDVLVAISVYPRWLGSICLTASSFAFMATVCPSRNLSRASCCLAHNCASTASRKATKRSHSGAFKILMSSMILAMRASRGTTCSTIGS